MHFFAIVLALGVAPLVAAHGKITSATGNLGGNGTALGIVAGSGNSESDVTVFQGTQAKTFGETPGVSNPLPPSQMTYPNNRPQAGNNNPATGVPAAIKVAGSTTLPQISAGGTVTMVYHQVNADGAGPIACSIDTSGTGADFQAMTVTTNVPGTAGISTAADEDFPLVAQVPAGVTCAGSVAGHSKLCFVKCQNPVGPFGGVVAVQQGAAAAGTAAAPAAAGAAVADAAVAAKAPAAKAPAGSATAAAAKPKASKGAKKAKKGKKANDAAKGAAKQRRGPVAVRALLLEEALA